MAVHPDICVLDSAGAPALKEMTILLPGGGLFCGWWEFTQSAAVTEIGMQHGLGHTNFIVQTMLWLGNNAPLILSARKPHPNEAGPTTVLQTANWLHLWFEPNKPILMNMDLQTGNFAAVTSGRIGAYLLPV